MAFLFMNPSGLVPIILIVLILIVLVGIVVVTIRNINQRRRRMSESLRKMKKLEAAVSQLGMQKEGEAWEEQMKRMEESEKPVKNVKTPAKKKESGDKTIYDDRKKLSAWQVHLSKTYRDMKKKNPNTKFSAAMKAAKKTYKKK